MAAIPHDIVEVTPKKLLFKYGGALYELNKVQLVRGGSKSTDTPTYNVPSSLPEQSTSEGKSASSGN